MPNIHVLDSHVADLIAAGEVVERPASVVKELMENAIDAGASMIQVEIEHGGMTFLRVTDNGMGIESAELRTAFLRHATSKLRTEYDLESIDTLGFRGEALAAIAAVSKVEVLSRAVQKELGAALEVCGGEIGEVEEIGCPCGTTMIVRDLFFNTPARLKFMKKDTAEGAAVSVIVQRIALSHPEVSVTFIRDGKQELLTSGDGQLKSAVYAVLGRDLALGLREVNSKREQIAVHGFVSMPACCRGSRSLQFFFVNGRQVKSPVMMSALEEAYKNQRMVGKFPACVLHLELKQNAVDVNVHPAKTEVKFGDDRQVFSAVYHAVLSTLNADQSRPSIKLQSHTGQTQGAVLPHSEKVVEKKFVQEKQDMVTPNQTRISMQAQGATIRVCSPEYRPLSTGWYRLEQNRVTPELGISEKVSEKEQQQKKSEEVVPSIQAKKKTSKKPLQVEESKQEAKIVEEMPAWRIVGEVLNTYIIVEQENRVFFIDKHAAHERMNFDRMKAQGYDPMSQTLLVPVVCRVSVQEQQILLEQQALLREFGFEMDELGGSLVVRQAPFDVDAADVEQTLSELAQKLLSGKQVDPASARDELLHTMACKAAIKGGWHTSQQELERLVQAVMSGAIRYCPHGRPVAIELTQKELEKQFKRS